MTDRTEGTEPTTEMRRKVRVAVRQEDLEDLKAHGGRYNGLAQTEEDVQGHGRGRWIAETEEDAEGQGFKYGLRPIGPDDDVEAKGYDWVELEPDPDDTSGQGFRYGG